MFKSGRYSGFDTMVEGITGSGIPIKINHTGSVIAPVGSDNKWGDPEGVVLTPHGVVIKDTSEIELDIAVGTGTIRTDVVYLEYQWEDDPVGFEPFVAVIQGADGGAIPPLGNEQTQVILGYIHVTATATTIAHLTYVPAKVPSLGGANIIDNYPELGETFAALAAHNTFTKYQTVTPTSITLALEDNGYLLLDDTSNTFLVNCSNTPSVGIQGLVPGDHLEFEVGTRITIMFHNVGAGSKLYWTQNGRVPGFVFTGNGLFGYTGGTYINLRNYDLFEFILLPNATWWAISMPSSVGYEVRILKEQMAVVMAAQGTPTAKITVPENGSGLAGRFAQTFFSNTPIPDDSNLKYRIDSTGSLELSGVWAISATTALSTEILVLTLPPTVNPGRDLYFSVTWRITSTLNMAVLPARIDSSGNVYVLMASVSLPNSTMAMNLRLSLSANARV